MRDERTNKIVELSRYAEILFLSFEPHLPWGYPITWR